MGANQTAPAPGLARLAARVLALSAMALVLQACNAPPVRPPARTADSPTIRTVLAEWDDVEAATRSAGYTTSAALVSIQEVSGLERIFTLATAGDEEVILTAVRTTSDNLTTIQVTVRAGAFGDADLEAEVADAMTGRLEALRGVRFAPLEGFK